jgi:hypothetical protein
MDINLPVVCGSVSTIIFVVGTLPMLVKAARSRDLSSYSLSNLAMSNAGNALNSVYVFTLPAGPVWALHGFYVVTTALMLMWYLRYTHRRDQKYPWGDPRQLDSSPDADELAALIASLESDNGGESRLLADRGAVVAS